MIDHLRKKKNSLLLINHDNDISDIIHDKSEPDIEINEVINISIKQLKESERDAFIMNKINGLSISEIALITQETDECIKKRVYRATQKMKMLIQKYSK